VVTYQTEEGSAKKKARPQGEKGKVCGEGGGINIAEFDRREGKKVSKNF